MQTLKQIVLNYFDELNYRLVPASDEHYHATQNRTGLRVELDFSLLGQGRLPQCQRFDKDKKLFFMTVSDAETIGFDILEDFVLGLDEHCSLAILEEEFFEHTMKEIWMFLSNDPRDRDVFKESRFYKA
ncbi:hypothetical protein [Enterovibrio paralichthyis]|uniref:hypothetical protein n=1 Tax=Enterovibrio paralichthyis TaxID=2853805 RepID=UPI001C43FC43|nr:hypothetical protein [Enterovibrio paralichthyis]MBV7296287.1 hypothetical protein [Enterovibrio paralichthyis]